MTIRKIGKLLAIAITSVTATFPTIVAGQTWPAKPIKIVIGFPPGGATDILSRDFAAKLGAEVVASSPAEASSMLKLDIFKWADVAKKSGAKID